MIEVFNKQIFLILENISFAVVLEIFLPQLFLNKLASSKMRKLKS